ncbi:hypothetical protein ACDQ55_02990 [Chitinophaga sp. 30R24]|uniref:hypothetical protein n=1 Tax=Chitinophaga sp. 30R24 TaxID=3248838 RepID=UPI003B8F8458
MKRIYLFSSVCLIVACNNQTDIDEVNDVIGTYVHQREVKSSNPNNNSTSKAVIKDTVNISRTASGEYLVKKSGVSETPQQDRSVYTSKTTTWELPAQYDKSNHELTMAKTILHLAGDNKSLYMGTEEKYQYKKIN